MILLKKQIHDNARQFAYQQSQKHIRVHARSHVYNDIIKNIWMQVGIRVCNQLDNYEIT